MRPEETKVYLKDKLEFNESAILYETEYISKIYRDGLLIDNPVKYKKIRLIDENNSDN